MPWTTMCFHILGEMSGSSRPLGFWRRRLSSGSSVASASAAMESMMRLTHRSCRTLSGVPERSVKLLTMAATKATVSATRLMVIWNCRNLRMLLKTERPQSTARTMEEKRSSRMMMSDASLATSVPERPIERPTSDSERAGASFVPSPVTATTSPRFLSARTSSYLSCGVERASTCSFGSTSLSFASSPSMARNVGPSIAMPSVRIPHSVAMCLAVRTLSPVTMRTTMPASWHVLTASDTSPRSGSLMPTMEMHVMSLSGALSKNSSPMEASAAGSKSRTARQMQRKPRLAMSWIMLSSSAFLPGVIGSTTPCSFMTHAHFSNTSSAAPLQ
mmetsp:Transcript_8941/g.29392  ORF Transcript_8941/g.29392 Transcript_8941/m.29392 type:complete len:331 (-) Transcript_8941:2057-3049(-)